MMVWYIGSCSDWYHNDSRGYGDDPVYRDGEEGYPGDVLYNVRYSLDEEGGVRIDFTGVEDCLNFIV